MKSCSFRPRRASLTRAYNALVRRRWMRGTLLRLGPFFRVVAAKPASE
ncbi:MAG: hypothetical protein ABJD07_06000 [Gemmatimonadaceae bacterium]